MKKFFGHAGKKIYSLGETDTEFSHHIKVQDLVTCMVTDLSLSKHIFLKL